MKGFYILVTVGFLFIFNSLEANQFVKKTFYSAALKQDKTYFVSYPDGYSKSDTTKKFPVVIFLHGAGVNAQYIADKFDSILSIPLYKALYSFLYPNFYPNFNKIIFIIADGSAAPYMGSFYTNSELYGNFETYIATDLYKEINENYNTYKHREKWAIMGHSMGGYGSMKIALKYPDQFIGEASLSGPLDITYYNDLLPLVLEENGNKAPYTFTYNGSVTKLMFSMAGAFSPNLSAKDSVNFPVQSDGTINQDVISQWKTENPIHLIKTWKGNPKMALFMYCGEKDEYKLLPQNKFFSDTLSSFNITHTFIDDPTGDHVNSLTTSFPQGLDFLCSVMDTAQIYSNPNSVFSITKRQNYVFPNPAKNRLNFSNPTIDGISKVTVISLSGSILKTYSTQNLKDGLDISILKPGYYLLSITYLNGQRENLNFIKAD